VLFDERKEKATTTTWKETERFFSRLCFKNWEKEKTRAYQNADREQYKKKNV